MNFKSLGYFVVSGSVMIGSAISSVSAGSAWPQWRGIRGSGQGEGSGYPLTWSESENVVWKVAIPGRGWSSPVILDGQVWMTYAIEVPCTPEQEKERLKVNTGDQPLTLLSEVRLHAIGLDATTGKVLHDVEVLTEKNPQWVHKQNSYASPTPFLEKGRLYAHFGTFGNACVDTETGKVVWTNTEVKLMHENGPGSSTVVWGDKVFFNADGSDTQSQVALDKTTGRIAWKTQRSGEMKENVQLKKSYGTPLVIEREGQPLLISNGADWLYAYDPKTGAEKWRHNYGNLGFSLSALPIEGEGMVFYSTGFMKPALQAVRCFADKAPELVWTCERSVPTIPSPLLAGKEIFFVADSNICTSLDVATGKENYRERLGGNFNASPVFADSRIYVTNREGTTFVLAAGSEFKKLAENKLPGQQWASFAAVDGSFFIRTDTALYRVGKK